MKLQTISMRPKVLKEDVYKVICNDNGLMGDLATVLDVSLLSIPSMLQRRSRRFKELPALSLIASRMNCKPEELLQDEAK